MSITKEYLDKKFKEERQHFEHVLDKKLDNLDKKIEKKFDYKLGQKLEEQSKDLKNYIKAENTHLVVMIQEQIIEPMEERFERLEAKVDSISAKKWVKEF